MISSPTGSIEVLLEQLQAASSLPQDWNLNALSDLSLHDLRRVQEVWPLIEDDRRRHVVATLIEQCKTDLHLHLGRLLRLALNDALPEIRIMAIKGLWEEIEPDLVGPLIKLLENDPEASVRAAAAEALGAFVLAGEVDELSSALAIRIEDALLAVLHDESEPLDVQASALESISFSGETGIRELIEDGYYSPYEEMRVAALHAMGHSADVRWRALAQAELDSPSPLMRAAAAWACGSLEARDALENLILLLTDPDKSVRLASIFALGRLGGKRASEVLDEVAASDDSDEVAAAKQALEEALFYGNSQEIPLFDETASDLDDQADEWEDW